MKLFIAIAAVAVLSLAAGPLMAQTTGPALINQIRIHLATQRASITGDGTYGGKPFLLSQVKRDYKLKKGTEEEPFMKRMALHAFSLQFKDMADNRQIIEAPYPKDFQALIRQLELNS